MKISVILEALTGGFETDLKRASRTSERAFKQMRQEAASTARTLRSWAAGAGVGAAFYAVVRGSAEAEKAIAQLDTALESSGGTVGRTRQQLQQLAKDLQDVTTFDDESIIAAETRMLHFSNVTGDTFDRAIKISADFAERMKRDIPEAAQLVGKALNNPTKGLLQLSRAGAQFSAAEQDTIKALMETGRLADAQTLILDKLAQKFGGAAEAARGTFAGALKALKNQLGELAEAPGGLGTATDSVNELTEALKDPAIAQGIGRIVDGFIRLVSWGAKGFAIVTNAAADMGAAIARSRGEAAIGDLEGQMQKLADLQFELETARGFSILGDNSAEIRAIEARIAKLQEEIKITNQLAADRTLLNQATGAGAGAPAGPGPNRAGLAGANAKFELASKELDAIIAKSTDAKQALETVRDLTLASMDSEARGVEELAQQYAKLDEAVKITGTSAGTVAKIRAGLAAQLVKPLQLEALTDEQQAVAALGAKYVQLENLVHAGALARAEADRLGARYSEQWLEAEQRKVDQFRQSMAGVTDYDRALAALTEQLKELQRITDAGGPGAPTQAEADRIKAGMRTQFDTEQEADWQGKFQNATSGLLLQNTDGMGAIDKERAMAMQTELQQYQQQAAAIQALIDETSATELDKQAQLHAALEAAEQQHNDAMRAIDQDAQQAKLQVLGQAFGNFASLMQTHNAKLFRIGQAFAIAQAVVNVATGVTEALKLGPILGPILAASVATAGAVQIATILGQSYSGEYDQGGDIARGAWGIVGERGPEIVSGPATVIGREETARLLNGSGFRGAFDRGGYLPDGPGSWGMGRGEMGRAREPGSNSALAAAASSARQEPAPQDIKVAILFDVDSLADELARRKSGERMVVHHLGRNPRVT